MHPFPTPVLSLLHLQQHRLPRKRFVASLLYQHHSFEFLKLYLLASTFAFRTFEAMSTAAMPTPPAAAVTSMVSLFKFR